MGLRAKPRPANTDHAKVINAGSKFILLFNYLGFSATLATFIKTVIRQSSLIFYFVEGKHEGEKKSGRHPFVRNAMIKVLSLKQLREYLPLSRSQIYRLQKQGRFPKSVRLGPARVGILESELQSYLEGKIAERDASTASISPAKRRQTP